MRIKECRRLDRDTIQHIVESTHLILFTCLNIGRHAAAFFLYSAGHVRDLAISHSGFLRVVNMEKRKFLYNIKIVEPQDIRRKKPDDTARHYRFAPIYAITFTHDGSQLILSHWRAKGYLYFYNVRSGLKRDELKGDEFFRRRFLLLFLPFVALQVHSRLVLERTCVYRSDLA